MNNNAFFKLTPLYKEFIILDYIEKDANITQRMIGEYLGIAVSMVNVYLDDYEKKGFVRKKYLSSKSVKYYVTKKGIERKKVLNIGFLKETQCIYNLAKENIYTFLKQIYEKGYKRLLLYGAGEVAEILLQVIKTDKLLPIDVIAVIDDDIEKQGKEIINTPIVSLEALSKYDFDGILISSYTNNEVIKEKLINKGFLDETIIEFFK